MTTLTRAELTEDALREVTTIGAGHSATMLAKLTGHRVMIDPPRLASPDANSASGDYLSVSLQMLGDLTGHTAFLMARGSALKFSDVLIGREPGSGTELGELEQSSLTEVGNILASSFMSSLSNFMGKLLIPSVPELCIDGDEQLSNGDDRLQGRVPTVQARTRFRFTRNGASETQEPEVLGDLDVAFILSLNAESVAEFLGSMLPGVRTGAEEQNAPQ